MFYVYAYYDLENGIIFYIGKGTKRRFKVLFDRNDLFKEYYSSHKCDVRILAFFDNEDDAFAYEQRMIKEYKSKNQCFCNKDYGGLGGVAGYWTEEKKLYQSVNNPMKDKKQRERMSKNNPMKQEETMRKNLITRHDTFTFMGKEYYCFKDCASDWGFTLNTISFWIKNNISIEEIIPHPINSNGPFTTEERKKILHARRPLKKETKTERFSFTFLNTQYKSISEAERILKISSDAIKNWKTKEDAILSQMPFLSGRKQAISKAEKDKIYHICINKKQEVVINGTAYNSVKEASNKLDIKYGTLLYRIHSKSYPDYCFLEDNQQPSQENSQTSILEGSTTNG